MSWIGLGWVLGSVGQGWIGLGWVWRGWVGRVSLGSVGFKFWFQLGAGLGCDITWVAEWVGWVGGGGLRGR